MAERLPLLGCRVRGRLARLLNVLGWGGTLAPVFQNLVTPVLRWVCLVIFPPPLYPAFVAAEPAYPSRPLRLIFFPAIWADLLWMLPLCPLLRYLLLVVSLPAVVTANPPPPPRSAVLFHPVPSFRADVHRNPIVSLG